MSPGTVQAMALVSVDKTVSVHAVICRQIGTATGQGTMAPGPQGSDPGVGQERMPEYLGHSVWGMYLRNVYGGVCVFG